MLDWIINIISVILGGIAWVLPLKVIVTKRKTGYHYVVISLGLCAISVQIQVFKILAKLSKSETELDFEAVINASGIMMAGTFLLLALSLWRNLPLFKNSTKTASKNKNKN